MTHTWVDAIDCDRRVFRTMLGSFMTGVTVVATRGADGKPRAFTANSFTSVSLDPPLVLVCLAKSSASLDVFMAAGSFSISMLSDWQREASNAFASRDPAIKAAAMERLGADDVPHVEGSLATILCDTDRTIDAGDHIILLGAVKRFQMSAGQPLGYFRGNYVGFGLAVRELEQMGAPLQVAGLLERNGKVLLCRRPGALHWEVPAICPKAGEQHSDLLRGLYKRLGVTAEASLLYSLFQERGDHRTTMVFSMEAVGNVEAGTLEDGTVVDLFGEADRPWELIDGFMRQGMLRRFFKERAVGCFGIYYDTADGGRVVALRGEPLHWTAWQPDEPVSSST